MNELQSVKLADLHASPFNPRKTFDKTSLDELADSIRTQGIQSPLLVRSNDKGYEIVAGERRFRAAKLAGLKEVPCIVRDFKDDADVRRAQIVENLHREDVTPLEEAQGYQDLLKEVSESGGTAAVKSLAEEVGKSVRHVYARLQLLGVSDPVKKALAAGKIESSHAQELVPLKPEQQKEMLGRIEEMRAYDDGGISVSELREEIKYRFAEKPKAPKLSAKERAERKRQADAYKKQQDAWKRADQVSHEKREVREAVNKRVLPELWGKLKSPPVKAREWFIDLAIDEALSEGRGVDVARSIAKLRKGAKLNRWQRASLVVMGVAANDTWPYREPGAGAMRLFKWAGIDYKKTAREIAAERKAKAAAPSAKVQTSAKPVRKAKKRTAKRKARK